MGFFKFLDRNHFSCTNCGKCCQSGWNVAIRPSDVVKIEASVAFKTRHKAGFTPIVLDEGQHLAGKNSNGGCTFFTHNGCEIHRELGSSSKPGICQVYPFQMAVTPDGIYVSLAFSCPAAVAGFGLASESYEQELTTLFREPLAEATYEYLRTADTPIEWMDYCQLEKQMLAELSLTLDDPVSTLLQWACRVIHPQATSEELDSLYDLAFNLLPLFATSSLSAIENRESNEARQEFQERLIQAEGVRSEHLGCELPAFTLCRPQDTITREAVSRYIRQSLEGKRLLSGPTLATRLLLLGCGVALVLYLNQALTKQIDDGRFSFAALEKAFEVVEFEMITHGDCMDDLYREYESVLVKSARAL